ncbi:MAG: RecQ family zinc-binding domain-containing protein, partial [Muribaculaceae bacterium]|nr:RecQ family zinc-binding domain-containing protein [Muribaculaceae bacterium]
YERVCNFLKIAIGEGYDRLYPFDLDSFCNIFGYQRRQCLAALHLLSQSGFLEFLEETDHRSRIMMTVEREELYNLHSLSPEAERLLKIILRLYTGLFTDYVNISETILSAETSFSEEKVYELLLELSRAKVIKYVPRSKTPYIYVPTSREEPKYITIPKSVYEDRRKILSNRVEAIINYAADTKGCREDSILKYFGENREENCGQCDICRNRKKNIKVSRQEKENLIDMLLEFIAKRPHGVDFRIISHSFNFSRERISEILSFLVSEGYLEVNDNAYSLPKGMS